MDDNWTREQTLSFIKHLRRYPLLYKSTHPDYTKTPKKKEALRNIAAALKDIKPDISAHMLRKKIKALTHQLNTERKKMGTEEDYIPTLWCYSYLQFIIDANVDAAENSHIDFDKSITSEEEEENSDENFRLHSKEEQSTGENWTREQTLSLINELRKYPLLYKTTHPDFMKLKKRNKAFRRIVTALEDEKPGLTISVLKQKIKTLSRQINTENKRMLSYKGSGTANSYIPTLWCYSHLQFMLEANADGSSNIDTHKESKTVENWTRDQTLFLINELRKYPLLYKTTHPYYIKVNKRNEALRNIAEAMEDIKPGVTNSILRKKIKTLSRQISTEKNRMLNFKSSGKEDYIPTLWCYSDLQFMLDANVDAVEISNIDSNKSATTEDENSDAFIEQHSNEIPQESFDTAAESFHKSAINTLDKVAAFFNKTKDDTVRTKENLFCSMLCAELKRLKFEETYYDVTTEILQVIKTAKARERNLL